MRRGPVLLTTVLLLVGAGGSLAPADAQPRRGRRDLNPDPPVAWRHTPPSIGTMTTRAERVSRDGSLVTLEGYAQVAWETMRVQADRIEIDEEAMSLSAQGNVVFERGDEKVVAESLLADLESQTAVFENARGILGPDFHFVAERVEERPDGSLVVERGAFTSCAQPSPRWHFTASRAVVEPERHVWLRNVAFRVKNVPVLFLPAIYYPIEEDGRQTGFLLPRYSRSDTRGHLISQGFYWAINRSMDATVSVDHFTVAGTGMGLEYRYRGDAGSRADGEGFLINDKTTENREYSLTFDVAQRLPARFRLSAQGDMFSSFDFSRRFTDSFSRSTRRYQRAKINLNGQLFRHRIQFLADRKDTEYTTRTNRRQELPELTIRRRNMNLLGRYVQLGYELGYARVGQTKRNEFEEWSRLFVGPTVGLSMPQIPFLDARAELEGGYLRYGGSRDPETKDFDPARNLSRRFYGTSFNVTGPKLERIFEPPNNFYAARLKHLIEPEVRWDYSRSDENDDLVNRFDRYDRAINSSQISVGLVNRVLAKRWVDGIEESTATDLITWRVQQSYYFEPSSGAFDSRYTSSSYAEESEVEKSPIRSDFRFRPSDSVNGDWTMEWDPDDRIFTSIRSGLRIGDRFSNRSMNFTWSRRARLVGTAEDQEVKATSFLRAGADFFPRQTLRTGMNINYDISERRMSNLRVRVDVLVQCCGLNVEWIRYNLSSRQENLFHFGITLGGITSFGFGTGGDQRRNYY